MVRSSAGVVCASGMTAPSSRVSPPEPSPSVSAMYRWPTRLRYRMVASTRGRAAGRRRRPRARPRPPDGRSRSAQADADDLADADAGDADLVALDEAGDVGELRPVGQLLAVAGVGDGRDQHVGGQHRDERRRPTSLTSGPARPLIWPFIGSITLLPAQECVARASSRRPGRRPPSGSRAGLVAEDAAHEVQLRRRPGQDVGQRVARPGVRVTLRRRRAVVGPAAE